MEPSPDELVRDFLRAQNLEQIGRLDEALELYEKAVTFGFDAAGPYDRLIFIYQERQAYEDLIRVAKASLSSVHTYAEKRAWYESQIELAKKAIETRPQPR